MERRRGRVILGGWARWGLTAVAVLLVGVIGASYYRAVRRVWSVGSPSTVAEGGLAVEAGLFIWGSDGPTAVLWFAPDGAQASWRVAPAQNIVGGFGSWWPPHPRTMSGPGWTVGVVPLWPWALASGAGAFWLWRGHVVRRRRERAGCCACGYSRAGLSAGAACPECGRGAAGAGA
jgi:hypothetical protein